MTRPTRSHLLAALLLLAVGACAGAPRGPEDAGEHYALVVDCAPAQRPDGQQDLKRHVCIGLTAVDVPDGFDEGVIIDSVLGGVAHLRPCYQNALLLDRDLKGRHLLAIEIKPNGRVARAWHPDRTPRLGDGPVEACMARNAERMRFPAQGEELWQVRALMTFRVKREGED